MLNHSTEPHALNAHLPPVPPVTWVGTKNCHSHEVSRSQLEQLLRGEVGALVIPSFIPAAQALATAAALESSSLQSHYRTLRDQLTKIGSTLYENLGGEHPSNEKLAEYLERAAIFSAAIEEICASHGQSPMTQIGELLGLVLGAKKLELAGREAFAGLVRVVRKGNEILPHQDELGEDMPSLAFANRLQPPGGQFAVNMYLQVPEQGGELHLWQRRYTFDEMKNMRLASSDYGIDPALLPPPDCVVKPKVGDLIFFDSSRMHAVSKASGVARISISLFLGIADDGEARYWS
jgi:hypothetical protein